MKRNLKELEHRIGYTFQDFALLKKMCIRDSIYGDADDWGRIQTEY